LRSLDCFTGARNDDGEASAYAPGFASPQIGSDHASKARGHYRPARCMFLLGVKPPSILPESEEGQHGSNDDN
jgi:hypothetical protein